MSEQIEIEFKTMLTQEEYHHLLDHFGKKATDGHTQTNYYFDTPSGQLQELGCGLRIRKFAQSGEQTLKSPQPVGLLETTDPLRLEEIDHLIATQSIKQTGVVGQKLRSFNVEPTSVHLFADLTTHRIEIELPQGLLAIDESWYANQKDYELELEVSEENTKESLFLDLLGKWNIRYKPSKNKIKRAKAAFDKQNEETKK